MRTPWKVRVAGCGPRGPGAGVNHAEPARLLTVIADGAFDLGAFAALKELGGAAADARVHAHVVRGVEAEGETAFRDIQLV
jgi:hypothetical protein